MRIALGVRGIARDLAAAGLGRLKPLKEVAVEATAPSLISWGIDLPTDQAHLAPRVAGRTFAGVRNGDAPAMDAAAS